jgi:hypothetical protein
VVWAERPAGPAGGAVAIASRVGIRVYLSVGTGGEPASDFDIVSLQAGRDPGGRPLVAAEVRNTGGRALDLVGGLRLADGPGGLAAGPFPVELGTTVGVGQSAPVRVTLDPAVPAGPWSARLALRAGPVRRAARARIVFPPGRAAAAGRVVARPDGGGLAAVAAGVGLAVLLTAVLLAVSRRRRRPRPA